MQKENPVIKNYILSSEKYLLKDSINKNYHFLNIKNTARIINPNPTR